MCSRSRATSRYSRALGFHAKHNSRPECTRAWNSIAPVAPLPFGERRRPPRRLGWTRRRRQRVRGRLPRRSRNRRWLSGKAVRENTQHACGGAPQRRRARRPRDGRPACDGRDGRLWNRPFTSDPAGSPGVSPTATSKGSTQIRSTRLAAWSGLSCSAGAVGLATPDTSGQLERRRRCRGTYTSCGGRASCRESHPRTLPAGSTQGRVGWESDCTQPTAPEVVESRSYSERCQPDHTITLFTQSVTSPSRASRRSSAALGGPTARR
jgi:hypothetical protein